MPSSRPWDFQLRRHRHLCVHRARLRRICLDFRVPVVQPSKHSAQWTTDAACFWLDFKLQLRIGNDRHRYQCSFNSQYLNRTRDNRSSPSNIVELGAAKPASELLYTHIQLKRRTYISQCLVVQCSCWLNGWRARINCSRWRYWRRQTILAENSWVCWAQYDCANTMENSQYRLARHPEYRHTYRPPSHMRWIHSRRPCLSKQLQYQCKPGSIQLCRTLPHW